MLVRVLNMTDRLLLLEENFDQFVMRVDGWRLSQWLDLLNVIELIVVASAIGFVLGYMCAVRIERARVKVIPVDIPKSTSSIGTQSKKAFEQIDWSTITMYLQEKA